MKKQKKLPYEKPHLVTLKDWKGMVARGDCLTGSGVTGDCKTGIGPQLKCKAGTNDT